MSTWATRELPRRLPLGHRDLGAPGRGRQRLQRQLAAEHLPGSHYAEPSGDACDHYHRYASDIALIAGLGLRGRTASRWSGRASSPRTASSRVPRSTTTGGCWTLPRARADAHLSRSTTSPRRAGSPPPAAGRSARTAERFARFCERAMRHLGDLVPYACTLNEPNLGGLLHGVLGHSARPRGERRASRPRAVPERCEPARRRGHARGAPPRARGDQGRARRDQRRPDGRDDRLGGGAGGEEAMARLRGITEDAFLEGLEGDFIGVQNYTGMRVGPGRARSSPARTPSARRWATLPARGARARDPASRRDDRPAGLRDRERRRHGRRRAARASSSRARSRRRGVPAPTASTCAATSTGRCSTTSSGRFGYRPTFGLVAVDRATQERTVKPSARHLGAIARANGL